MITKQRQPLGGERPPPASRGALPDRDRATFFICYRRADAKGTARGLADRLRLRFGERSVFMDLANRRVGRWRERISQALDGAVFVIVVIGPRWLEELGKRDPRDDQVRFEITSALQRGASIVPVLVESASVPVREALTEDIAELLEYEIYALHDDLWERSIDELCEDLMAHLEVRDAAQPQEGPLDARLDSALQGRGGAVAAQALQQTIESGHAEWSPRAAFAIGRLWAQKEDFAAAKAAFTLAIESGHHDMAPRAANRLAVLLEREHDWVGARRTYQIAIDAHHEEQSPRAAWNLGEMLETRDQLEDARAAYELALRSGHREWAPRSAYGLGRMLARHRDVTGAGTALRLAIESGHRDYAPKAANGLGVLLELNGDPAGAEAAYRLAIDARHVDESGRGAWNLGDLLDGQDDLDGARSAYQLAIDGRHPEWAPRAAYRLGRLLARHKEVDGARAAFELAIASKHAKYSARAATELAKLPIAELSLAGAAEREAARQAAASLLRDMTDEAKGTQ